MKYGLIGEHLKHSFSKEIHAAIGEYEYEILELTPSELEPFIKAKDFLGINVTIPYKEAVIHMLDYVDPFALEIGAVNTVVNRNGKLCGYNTDFMGMKYLVEKTGVDVRNKKVLIVGTGGTSKTATAVVRSLGCKEIVYVSHIETPGAVSYEEMYEKHTDSPVVFNTSPVGMYPKNYNSPLDLTKFPCLEGVIDVVYNPISTALVQSARELGIKANGGLYMLGAQAVFASGHFFDTGVDDSLFERVFKSVLHIKDNVSLIGMPSCGKTTVGKELARLMGKKFVDTDIEIEKEIGMPIPEYFKLYGESEFRRVEREVIARVSMEGSQVIATGGGAVLFKENMRALKQNGDVYFIDRSLNLLCPTGDRPLSRDFESLKKRYEERYPLYTSYADVTVNGDNTVEAVAKEIYEEYLK